MSPALVGREVRVGMGTCGIAASFDARGNLTLHSVTQVPFLYRRDMAAIVGIPPEKIRVIQATIGGGFGSMHAWYDVMPALNGRAHSIAIDMIGFGESDRLPGRDIAAYSWDRHVDLLDLTLERLGLDAAADAAEVDLLSDGDLPRLQRRLGRLEDAEGGFHDLGADAVAAGDGDAGRSGHL